MSSSLFDQPRPMPDPPAHHNAPLGTSSMAARAIKPKAPSQRERVLAAIRAAGPHGLADHEGERQLNLMPQSYTPRRRELAQAGIITDSGKRRLTPARRPAAVWVAIELYTSKEAS